MRMCDEKKKTDGGTAVGPQATSRSAGPTESWWRRVEGPTWLVAVALYGLWGLLTWFHEVLPWWALLVGGAWTVAWHLSFQHEAIHGHPTEHAWLNRALAYPPLSLVMPYALYRDSHLRHHRCRRLTCPVDDPESFYRTPAQWDAASEVQRRFWRFCNTLAGRLSCGPLVVTARLVTDELGRLRRGDRRYAGAWAAHLVAVVALWCWVAVVCAMPTWQYLALFAYPGFALALLRSFAEHRPHEQAGHRSAVTEAGLLMSLLYLNNNLHPIHHRYPRLAWYRIADHYRAHRAQVLRDNGGLVYRGGYLEQARRFLWRPKDSPLHPLAARWRADDAAESAPGNAVH